MTPAFTVLGAAGFIGRHLVQHLRGRGHAVEAPAKAPADAYVQALLGRPLGHVIYCVGLTADFRTRPFETVDAHVSLLRQVLDRCDFTSLTYLSSTRVYLHSNASTETTVLRVDPAERDDIFALSKLLGESLCLRSGETCRIVRPSNVFGFGDRSENFLSSILRDAKNKSRVTISMSPQSAKDYVAVEDVVRWTREIALTGRERVYNLAGGRNVTNAEIAGALARLGIPVEFEPGGPTISFPPIDISRVTREFGAPQITLTERLPQLFKHQT